MRSATGIAVAVALALGVGWVWGASGKAAVLIERRGLEERAEIAEAQAAVRGGQLSAIALNFGDAVKAFAGARRSIELVQIHLRETAQAERAGRLEIVLAHLKDAERLAGALDAQAQKAAEEADKALQDARR